MIYRYWPNKSKRLQGKRSLVISHLQLDSVSPATSSDHWSSRARSWELVSLSLLLVALLFGCDANTENLKSVDQAGETIPWGNDDDELALYCQALKELRFDPAGYYLPITRRQECLSGHLKLQKRWCRKADYYYGIETIGNFRGAHLSSVDKGISNNWEMAFFISAKKSFFMGSILKTITKSRFI